MDVSASSARTSLWQATGPLLERPPLQDDLRADVAIVGGGIAGLSTAYLLARTGRAVVVLDAGRLGAGMTAMTTAHLSNAIDDRYVEIERLHGENGARLAAQSHTAAIDRIETIVRDEQVACDFERLDGFLVLGEGDDERLLDDELAAARRAGLHAVRKLEKAPLPSADGRPCLRFPGQGQFHPLQYLAALARGVERLGGRLFTGSHVEHVQGGASAHVLCRGHRVSADVIVVATNTPVNDRVALHTRQSAYVTYALAARIPRGVVPRALFWDTEDPYHYVRTQPLPDDEQHELLVVGGEDHKTGQATDTLQRHERLQAWARVRFPMLGPVEHAWSGEVMETIDGLAHIGRNKHDDENVLVATGDSGMGMTHGTIAGILLTDLVLGRPNPWAALYDPGRHRPRASRTYLGETLNMAAQYRDWLTAGEISSTDEVEPGEGAILRRGLRKVAVHRAEDGTLHELSAVCPHLGGIVRWNASERTWDCPCHGSRFAATGEVIHGPANRGLSPAARPAASGADGRGRADGNGRGP